MAISLKNAAGSLILAGFLGIVSNSSALASSVQIGGSFGASGADDYRVAYDSKTDQYSLAFFRFTFEIDDIFQDATVRQHITAAGDILNDGCNIEFCFEAGLDYVSTTQKGRIYLGYASNNPFAKFDSEEFVALDFDVNEDDFATAVFGENCKYDSGNSTVCGLPAPDGEPTFSYPDFQLRQQNGAVIGRGSFGLTPVPLPATLSLLLAGFACIGLLSTRGRKHAA